MNRQKILILGLLIAAAVLAAGVALAPRLTRAPTLSGYIEGEPLYLAAPIAGAVQAVYVVRGQQVAAGAPLFVVDPKQLGAQRDQAAAELAAAQAQARDARQGQRPVELKVLDANIAAAQARAHDAAVQLQRTQDMAAHGVASRAQLDDARATARTTAAQLAAARRQREAAGLGARQEQIAAADARVAQARAKLAGAEARLWDLAPKAPSAARVEDVFFQTGEWASSNQPILALLPNDRIKVRFFVPERALSAYRPGRTVRFSCDGCAKGLSAKIAYVSPRPEFTPPVIYSREARDRLVYLVEAIPSARLNPGQPVDVRPLEAGS
jgi:HlyD family secretion protein